MNEEQTYLCSECGSAVTEEYLHEFDERILCSSCLDSLTTICNCCGERIWRSDDEGDGSISLCSGCREYNYVTCEGCGSLIPNDEANYDDDYPYCNECYRKLQECAIKSYNYKPEPIFYGSGNLFYGVELEIDKGGERSDYAEAILNSANMHNEHLYAKHDGSINDGFELVSHPMTLDYHTNHMNWQEVMKIASDLGYRSHQTQTCGLHIHVSRSAFGKDYATQEDAISRIVHFVEMHWNELLKFSRRTEENINRWASRYGISTTAKDTYKNAKEKHCGRYVAVNLENYATIEFRLFRGTLRYKTFLATLQLVDEICLSRMKRLRDDLILNDDMDYEMHSKYNTNVYRALSIFENIHAYLNKIPPYNKTIKPDYMTLDDLINKYDLFFEDGIDDPHEEITWETTTQYGTGEINDLGHGILRLHTFCLDSLEDIKKYDKEWAELLYGFHDKLNDFFNQYIAFLESYKTVFEIFKPFIDEFLHRKETYLTPTELAKAFDEYNKKHGINFTKIQCHMNSFRYKSLIDSSGNSILCEEINFEDLQSFLYFDFFNGIRNNYIPNKCKNCGKYFLIQGGKYFSYCNRKLKDEPSKTCRDVGSRRRYDDKCKNDPIWQTYNRAYKAHYARYMKKKMTISEFEEWSRFASEIRDKAIAGEISYDDYYTQIRK